MADRDPSLSDLLNRRNAVRDIAAACGISTAAVSQWTRVPVRHLHTVADVMKVSQDVLRPDLANNKDAA